MHVTWFLSCARISVHIATTKSEKKSPTKHQLGRDMFHTTSTDSKGVLNLSFLYNYSYWNTCLFTKFVPWDFKGNALHCLDEGLLCMKASSFNCNMWFSSLCSIDLSTTSFCNEASVSWGVCMDGKTWAKGRQVKAQRLWTSGFEKMKAWGTARCSLEILLRDRAL